MRPSVRSRGSLSAPRLVVALAVVLMCGAAWPGVPAAFAGTIQQPPAEATPMPGAPATAPGQPQPQQPRVPSGPGRPGLPTRDASRTPSGDAVKGTAIIRGRVVALDGGQPLRRAQVRVSGGSLRGRGRMTTTDADGRYEFRDLAAGMAMLNAKKSGYATVAYGQRGSRDSLKPVRIAEGQVIERIDFALPRGSVITGRVLDEFGEPVEEARVTAMQYRLVNGRRRLEQRTTATANDLGQYRLFGLTPGEYYVAATTGGGMMSEGDDDSTGYAPTFFAGTLVAAEAQRIALGVGEEFAADVPLTPSRLVRITGTIVDSAGQPLRNGFVSARPAGTSVGAMGMRGGPVNADGKFELTGVTPGSYLLVSQGGGGFGDGETSERERETAFMPLTVGADDVIGVRLVTSRGATLRGRVAIEGATTTTVPRIGVTCQPVEAEVGMFGGGVRMAVVQENQTFEIKGIFGACVVRANATSDLMLKSVLVSGSDVTDQPIDLSKDRLAGDVTILFTTRVTSLTGHVQGTAGKAEADYTVVIFPSDKTYWDGFSRRIRRARADQNGAFSVKGLPPGEYLVVALTDLETGAEQDPELLAQLAGLGTPASLAEGGMQSISLKLSELR